MSVWDLYLDRILRTAETSEAVFITLDSREQFADEAMILRAQAEARGYALRYRTLTEPSVKVAVWVERLDGGGL